MGAAVLYGMARKLKVEGSGDLRKQFLKDLREAAKPLLPAVRKEAAARFPKHGGLNRHMAKGSRYRTVAKTGATTAGVSIRANKTDPRADTQGRVAHPIPDGRGGFLRDDKGHRIVVVQEFPQAVGFFRDPIEHGAPAVRDEIIAKLERWAHEVFGPRL